MKYSVFVLLVLIILGNFGCDAQVEKNIERLESARDRLVANPKDEEALSLILRLMNDRNGINRANAAVVLGQAAEQVGGAIKEKALPSLVKLLDEGDGFDKRAAAIGIRGFGVHAVDAVPVLRKSLFPSDTDVAGISAEALGNIGEPASSAAPDLVKVIEENAVDTPSFQLRTREHAAHALGQIGPQAATAAPRLVELLERAANPEFKIQLAVSVIRIDPGNTEVVSEMEKMMRSFSAEERLLLMVELENAGIKARPALSVIKAAQNDNDPDVRSVARRLLEFLDGRN